jgi:hypothetical protein
MPYVPLDSDPDPDLVRRLTFVAFRNDGLCCAVPGHTSVTLPTGEVLPGEHWILDSTLRILLETAAFRFQRVVPLGAEPYDGGLHLYAWSEGAAPYRGERPHADLDPVLLPAESLAERLADPLLSRVVLDAARAYRNEDEAGYYANNLRLLEPAYLREPTAEGGSGLVGSPEKWRAHREHIVDGLDRDGTLLDIGCANGLLMETLQIWAGERGIAIEPYGVDLAEGLVDLARRRYPSWADRIEVGNAIDYVPSSGRRFTYVHTLVDCVPERRRVDLIRHVMENLIEPGGRILVSQYGAQPGVDRTARERLEDAGYAVTGESPGGTAWADKTWV